MKKQTDECKKTISVICGRIGSTFISTVIRGIENKANEKNYKIEFHSLNSLTEEETGKTIEKILKEKESQGVIVVSSTPTKTVLNKIQNSKIPHIFIERNFNQHHCIMIDNFKAGYNAGMHLIKKGRKKLGVILDPQTKDKTSATYHRLEGFKKCLKENSINYKDIIITSVNFHNIEEGRSAFDKIYKHIKKINGIFGVAGDLAAIGFLLEAKSHGITIPDDIAIIGFDDVEMASAVEPTLTTIKQPILKMGEEAINILHQVFNKKIKHPARLVLDTELIIRETT